MVSKSIHSRFFAISKSFLVFSFTIIIHHKHNLVFKQEWQMANAHEISHMDYSIYWISANVFISSTYSLMLWFDKHHLFENMQYIVHKNMTYNDLVSKQLFYWNDKNPTHHNSHIHTHTYIISRYCYIYRWFDVEHM